MTTACDDRASPAAPGGFPELHRTTLEVLVELPPRLCHRRTFRKGDVSTLRGQTQFLGRRIAYTYEVREIVRDERFVMSTAQGPFPMQTTYSWSDTESGATLMTLRNAGEPSGFGNMAAR
jgi:hypothetical protein